MENMIIREQNETIFTNHEICNDRLYIDKFSIIFLMNLYFTKYFHL